MKQVEHICEAMAEPGRLRPPELRECHWRADLR
jgi:hypothetical protein